MKRKSKKLLALCLVVSMILTNILFTNAAFAATRMSGVDRYYTALEISRNWTSASTVVLASGEEDANGNEYPDALAAAPYAYMIDAPILLTAKNALPPGVLDRIKALGATRVIIAGGEGAVSRNVSDALWNAGLIVERVAGSDRYATSLEFAKKMGSVTSAVIVNGDAFADALSVSAIAAFKGMPILLVQKDYASADIYSFLSGKRVYAIGGTGVIGDSFLATGAQRIAGPDRYATNLEVLKTFGSDLDFSKIFVATGEKAADALAGSVVAAKSKAPVVLVGGYLGYATSEYLKTKAVAGTTVISFGGYGAVSDSILSAIETSLVPSLFMVTSVNAVNLKQVLVTFNKELDKTFVENPAKYRFNGNLLVSGTDLVKLQPDKKSVLVTLGGAVNNTAAASKKMDNNTSYDFKVDAMLDTTGQYSAAYTTTVKYADSTIPTVSSIEVTGSKTLKVIFNEPIYKGTFGTESYTIDPLRFSIDGGVYPVVSAEFKADINAVEITLYTALATGSHTLKVKPDPATNAIIDYAGYRPLEQEVAFNVIYDTALPTVTVKEATDTSVRIVFSKPMNVSKLVNNTNVRFRHSYDQTLSGTVNEVSGTAVTAVANTDDKEFLITFGTSKVLPVGPNKLYIGYLDSYGTKVEDKYGNVLAAGYVDMYVAQDVTAPTVTSAVYVDKNTVEVTYSEDVLGGNIPSNYTIKDKDQTVYNVTQAPGVSGTNTYRLTTGSDMNGGIYTIYIANVRDKSLNANIMSGVTLTFTASDTVAPLIKKAIVYEIVGGAAKKVRIYFNEDMSDTGLTDKGNYSYAVNGSAVPIALATSDTLTKIDNKTVEIVFSTPVAGLDAAAANDSIFVSGSLTDLAGNRLSSNLVVSATAILDNAAITASYDSGDSKVAHALDKRTIEFKIDKLVSLVDFNKIKIYQADGATPRQTVIAATAVNDTVTGKATIRLTLGENLTKTDLSDYFRVDFQANAYLSLLGEYSLAQTIVFTNSQVKDFVAPLPLLATDIVTKDTDVDRQIDQIWVTYSEQIQTTSVQATDYTVEGYVVNDVSVLGNIVKVKINESGVVDETVTPKVTQVGEVADDSSQHNILGGQSGLTATAGTVISSVTSATVRAAAGTVTTAQSNRVGTLYLVKSTDSYTNAASLDALVLAGKATTAACPAANTNTTMATTGLIEGTYNVVAVQTADGLVSARSAGVITVDSTAPTASVGAATVGAAAGTVTNAQSTEVGTIYLVVAAAPIPDKATLDGYVTGGTATKATVATANTNTTMSTAGLASGTYNVVAVDTAGNVSARSVNAVTVDATIVGATAPVYVAGGAGFADDKITWTDSIAEEGPAFVNYYVLVGKDGATSAQVKTLFDTKAKLDAAVAANKALTVTATAGDEGTTGLTFAVALTNFAIDGAGAANSDLLAAGNAEVFIVTVDAYGNIEADTAAAVLN